MKRPYRNTKTEILTGEEAAAIDPRGLERFSRVGGIFFREVPVDDSTEVVNEAEISTIWAAAQDAVGIERN